jgi:hypothetical protein
MDCVEEVCSRDKALLVQAAVRKRYDCPQLHHDHEVVGKLTDWPIGA